MAGKLTEREKRALLLLGASLLVFIFLMYPTLRKRSSVSSRSGIQKTEREMELFQNNLAACLAIKGPVEEIDRKIKNTPSNFDLFGEVSKMLDQAGIRDRVTNISPYEAGENEFYKEKYVDMDIKKVTLNEAVELLKSIENSPAFLRVSQLSIKRRFSDDRTLDLVIRVSAYLPLEKGETP